MLLFQLKVSHSRIDEGSWVVQMNGERREAASFSRNPKGFGFCFDTMHALRHRIKSRHS